MKKFENKIALITGGSGLLGFTTAKELASQGAKVMLVDLNENLLQEKVKEAGGLGYDMSYAVADVTKSEQVKAYVDKTIDVYGKIDLFFNNAGIDGKFNVIEHLSEEDFDKVIAVNVKGVFLGMKYVIPKIQDGGSIVITSSIAGLIADKGGVAYHTSKHAAIGIMRTAAKEVADRKVRVNTVNPGFVDSPMMRNVERMMNPENNEEAQKVLESTIPLGRYAKPEDVSKLVSFLFSDDSSYVTGSIYVTDGGVVGY